MELHLKRIFRGADYTVGRLYIGPYEYLCDTLEPTARHGYGRRRAVAPGRYTVVVTWSPRFKRWLPLLVGVKGRDGIRIHAGNCPKDTSGCILVGRNTLPGCLLGSREKLDALMKRLSGRKDGEAVHLTIEEAHPQPLPKGGGTGG